ncbi:aldo/keto reductase [Pyxidicoccus xibeiensis]|uniref:aldo/keto reductase n=1 Tax=Pyxidicoccus xibeiensis TaxID=2906759 RepID=UPI0020A76F8A|nr:aldo/keto reductase [Pyxidicoccus xibeiensis]MCP3138263.1 aldo/keto reductase [Pyxidicoccus xibeiensis]
MRYRQLGNTGLLVSELCLGTMTFGGGDVWSSIGQLQQAEAERLVARSLEAGINFIDTADVYSAGKSELITGAALKNLGVKRTDVVLATKAYGATGPGPNDRGASRAHIMDAVKASLQRLGTDYIDLYQMHGFDSVTPVEETVRALDDLVRQGLVRYVGCSNARAWQVMKAIGIAEKFGWARFESLQAYYTLAGRDLERDTVSMLKDQKVGLLVWSPLAGGLLSGKFGRDQAAPEGARRVSLNFPPVNEARAFDCIDAMRPIAAAHEVSVAQVALAWLLHQGHVTSVIVGAKRVEQLDDNIAATKLKLSTAELEALNAVSALPAEYPGWMLEYWVDQQRLP